MSAWSRFHVCKIHQNPWSSTQVKPRKWTILNHILPCFLPTSPTSFAFRWIQIHHCSLGSHLAPYPILLKCSCWWHLYYWLVVDLPLWKIMEFVSWDYDIPNIWKYKSHVPNHQPVVSCFLVESSDQESTKPAILQGKFLSHKSHRCPALRRGHRDPGGKAQWYIDGWCFVGKIWMPWKLADMAILLPLWSLKLFVGTQYFAGDELARPMSDGWHPHFPWQTLQKILHHW